MSSINNIPFDINRTAMEKNTSVRRGGTVPVKHYEAIHPAERQGQLTDRRKKRNRRKLKSPTGNNKRLLTERRHMITSKNTDDTALTKAHKSGSLIDLEV